MSTPTPSKLDAQQVLQAVLDEITGRLRVDAQISASIIAPPGLEVSILATQDNIAIRNTNNSNELLINANGSITANVGTTNGLALDTSLATLNTSVNTLLKPANTLTAVTTLGTVTNAVKTIQLLTKPFDAVVASYPSGTQEVYTSKTGGTGGTTQQVVTINYTDATKLTLQDVAVV